MLILTDA